MEKGSDLTEVSGFRVPGGKGPELAEVSGNSGGLLMFQDLVLSNNLSAPVDSLDHTRRLSSAWVRFPPPLPQGFSDPSLLKINQKVSICLFF